MPPLGDFILSPFLAPSTPWPCRRTHGCLNIQSSNPTSHWSHEWFTYSIDYSCDVGYSAFHAPHRGFCAPSRVVHRSSALRRQSKIDRYLTSLGSLQSRLPPDLSHFDSWLNVSPWSEHCFEVPRDIGLDFANLNCFASSTLDVRLRLRLNLNLNLNLHNWLEVASVLLLRGWGRVKLKMVVINNYY